MIKHEIIIHTYIQQTFMMRYSPKAQGAYNEVQNCEENVQIYNIMVSQKQNKTKQKQKQQQKPWTLVYKLFLYKRKQNGQKITYVSKPEDVSIKMVKKWWNLIKPFKRYAYLWPAITKWA